MQNAATTTTDQGKTLGQSLRTFFTLTPPKVKPQIVVLFCRQLASFVHVGIPVTTAMQAFAEQAPTERLRETYNDVLQSLERGQRLSDAFARHPLVFPEIVTDMVRSAEVTGNLEQVLRQAARHIERDASARQRIRAAMTYPVIIATLAVVISIGMVVFVLPQFRDLYNSLGVSLPGLLRFLLGVSAYFSDHGLFIASGVLLALLLLGYWARTPRGRYRLDSLVLRLPIFGALVRASTTERFTRTLGDMLAAGVPISQAYPVVVANVRNRVHRSAVARVGSSLAAGAGISTPLADTGVFAPAVVQMVRVGEETGHLDENLQECAEMHEQELEYRIKRMTSFLEPALIVFVGLMVGFVAVSMVTSIYSLAGGFK